MHRTKMSNVIQDPGAGWQSVGAYDDKVLNKMGKTNSELEDKNGSQSSRDQRMEFSIERWPGKLNTGRESSQGYHFFSLLFFILNVSV